MRTSGALRCVLRGAATALLWLLATALAEMEECQQSSTQDDVGDFLRRGVNAEEQLLVLHLHNNLRDRVAAGNEKRGQPGPQPRASNMNTLVWDDELAEIAQRWADRKKFQHNPCRKSKNYSYVGENLAIQYVSGKPPKNFGWPKAVQDWYDEVAEWPSNHVSAYKFNQKTGHYTQLAWGSTQVVGCGAATYNVDKMNATLFVCNYAPGGNVVGTNLYAIGAPRSTCKGSRRSNSGKPSKIPLRSKRSKTAKRPRRYSSLCAP